MKYSFCEGVWAGPRSAWHIRARNDDQKLMPGGGIQTSSLCGRVLASRGWDLEHTIPTIANFESAHVCVHCTAAYKKEREAADLEANKDA